MFCFVCCFFFFGFVEKCGSAVNKLIESKAMHKRISERVNGWMNEAKTWRSVRRLLQRSSKR